MKCKALFSGTMRGAACTALVCMMLLAAACAPKAEIDGMKESAAPTAAETETPTAAESETPTSAESAAPTDAGQEDPEEAERMQLLRDYFEHIDKGEWEEWAACYAPPVRGDRLDLVRDPQNLADGVGILSITEVKLTETEKLPKGKPYYAEPLDSFPEEMRNVLTHADTFACYRIVFECAVDESKQGSDHYKDGLNKQVMTLVKPDGAWYVAETCAMTDVPPTVTYD